MDYIQLTAKVKPKQPATDILIAELADIGFESFEETHEGCKAWIPAELYREESLQGLLRQQDPSHSIDYEVELIPSQNWNEEWESHFEPIEINEKARIRAIFHPSHPGYEHEFIISPKMAFGTGHHETTWMMAHALFSMDLKGKTVLDMGCGTGILAIIAEKLGAARVLAIDIEQPSVENTLEHIDLNHCRHIEVQLGDAQVLGKEQFDVILANINRNVLLQDMNKYSAVLKIGGYLLLSGFFSTDIELLSESANNSGLTFVSQAIKNNWARLTFIKA